MNSCGSYCFYSISCLRKACFFCMSLSIFINIVFKIIKSEQSILPMSDHSQDQPQEVPHPTQPFTINIPANTFSQSIDQQIQAQQQLNRISLLSPEMRECYFLKKRVEKHEFGYFFAWPVDVYALGDADYFQVVQRPMDLNTIGHKLAFNFYKGPNQFNEDMTLMFSNALVFNKGNTEVVEQTRKILKYYLELFEELTAKYERATVVDDCREQYFKKDKKIESQSEAKAKEQTQKTKIQQTLRQYFNEQRLKIIAEKLNSIGQTDKVQIRKSMNAKFNLSLSEQIRLECLKEEELRYLLELGKEYGEQNYGCPQKLLEEYRRGKRIRKTRYGFEEEESSFEIEDS